MVSLMYLAYICGQGNIFGLERVTEKLMESTDKPTAELA